MKTTIEELNAICEYELIMYCETIHRYQSEDGYQAAYRILTFFGRRDLNKLLNTNLNASDLLTYLIKKYFTQK